MKYQLDTDFVVQLDCIARPAGWRRVVVDFLCRWLGHALWRPGSVVPGYLAGGSLDMNASYCRRCFRGGYVQSDYAPQAKVNVVIDGQSVSDAVMAELVRAVRAATLQRVGGK